MMEDLAIENPKIETIFNNIEQKLNNIESNILENCLSDFDYSDFEASFYPDKIYVINTEDEDVDIDEVIKKSVLEEINERIDTVKDLYLEAYITMTLHKDLFTTGYD